MNLGQLIEMQRQKALNIKYEEGENIATIGGVNITSEQALTICKQLGWTELYLNPFKIIDKTNKFVRGIKKLAENEYIVANTMVEFQNKRSNTYGKTFDRIHMLCTGVFEISIIYGMEHNGAAYVVYDSRTSASIAKCRSLSKVAECILGLM